MGACELQLVGSLIVGGPGCGCGNGSASKVQSLGFACAAAYYAVIASTDCAVLVQTAGLIGNAWAELPCSDAVGAFGLLYLKSNAPVRLRIGAEEAELPGSAGTFPTGFSGGETFAFEVDGTAVAVTFQAGDQSAVQVASRINQAAVAAGLAFLPASVQSSGQLALRGQATGIDGGVEVTTANATIGFPVLQEVEGLGEDVSVNGLFMAQFDATTAPERIQISGVAQVEVLAAGTAP